MNYTIKNGQNIFDVAINTIGNINNVYVLIQENNIPSVEFCPVGLSVSYTPPPITPPIISSPPFVVQVTSQDFSSISNQSIFDIVAQTYGNINLTYKLIQESNFSNILSYPIVGTLFIFNPTQINDAIFTSYLAKNNIIINTVGRNTLINNNSDTLQTDDGIDITTDDGIDIIID